MYFITSSTHRPILAEGGQDFLAEDHEVNQRAKTHVGFFHIHLLSLSLSVSLKKIKGEKVLPRSRLRSRLEKTRKLYGFRCESA